MKKEVKIEPDPLPSLIDVTTVGHYERTGNREFIPGLRRLGDMQFKVTFDPAQDNTSVPDYLRRKFILGKPVIINHDGKQHTGFITSLTTECTALGETQVCATIRRSSVGPRHTLGVDFGAGDDYSFPFLFSGEAPPVPHPNCRSVAIVPKEKFKMKKVLNKFYVASPNVTREAEQSQVNDGKNGQRLAVSHRDHGRWTRPTVDAAVEHARKQLEADPSLEHVAIVKIVKVVRRKPTPIVVEDVK